MENKNKNTKVNVNMEEETADGQTLSVHKPPSFFRVMWKEIYADKFALVALILLVGILITVFIGASFFDTGNVIKVDLKTMNQPPSKEFRLGTDPSGRDMIGQLFVGAKNSFVIAFGVTILCAIIGIFVGMVAGYYAGKVDNFIMRIIDFMMMLPSTMIIIVLVSIIPRYNVFTFILVMTTFGWMGKARLIRAKMLQQSSLDYVSASKTLGTRNFIIMVREVLPNIVSIIVVNLTLNLAGNIGLETGLSFLGFGLPASTPSLGTLTQYAAVPSNMQKYPWQWLPAVLLVFVMMLCINFVGQAIKRAADAKQRIS